MWEKTRDRNEALDTFVYARAAAAQVGLDRMTKEQWQAMKENLGHSIRRVEPILKATQSNWLDADGVDWL
jgi:phage terminase large subunit GpA-like protein